MKTCSKCKTPRPPEEFYRHGSFKDGRRSECKRCTEEKRAETPHIGRDWVRGKKAKELGVTVGRLLELVYGPCDICKAEPEESEDDDPAAHGIYVNRQTGVPVAVVCLRCSSALGFLGHSAERFTRALEVLARTDPLG